MANAPTHATSNANDGPTHASSSLVEEGGTTVPTESLLLAVMAAPVATSTAVTAALLPPTMTPTATPTTSFVNLNLIYYYLFMGRVLKYLLFLKDELYGH